MTIVVLCDYCVGRDNIFISSGNALFMIFTHWSLPKLFTSVGNAILLFKVNIFSYEIDSKSKIDIHMVICSLFTMHCHKVLKYVILYLIMIIIANKWSYQVYNYFYRFLLKICTSSGRQNVIFTFQSKDFIFVWTCFKT